jgi:EmrB/QacA subfamily drug resistance transporter
VALHLESAYSLIMKQARLVLWIAILASFVAFLDGSVINVALPAIASNLGGGFTTQQWVVDAYLITLGALMLIAGSLSDLYGRQRIMLVGLIGFGLTSLLCAFSPTSEFLIISRGLQGVAGALLVPSSLALIMTAFAAKDRGKAIGSWTAWTGMAFLIGPLLGGILVDAGSWRWVFAINVLPIILTIFLLSRLKLKEEIHKSARLDIGGALLGAIGLGGTVFALIEQSRLGWSHPLIYATLFVGIVSLIGFIWHERRTKYPMMPLGLFEQRNFFVGNIATVAVYAGLSIATFIVSIFVQQVGNYSATAAGLALLPITIIMFFLSARFGGLSGRYGPRRFMGLGPIVSSAGFLLMLAVDESVSYWTLLPGIIIFGLGLSMTVAPLTSAVLGAIEESHSGIASAINNAVSRIAGLVAIAALGPIIGAQLGLNDFHHVALITASLLFIGGAVSFAGIQDPPGDQKLPKNAK